jgi:hypothetical protein
MPGRRMMASPLQQLRDRFSVLPTAVVADLVHFGANAEIKNNYLCTYDLYGPVRNVFDAGRYIMWASERGLGPGNR